VQGTKLELSLKESSKMDLSAIPNEFIASHYLLVVNFQI